MIAYWSSWTNCCLSNGELVALYVLGFFVLWIVYFLGAAVQAFRIWKRKEV